MRPSQNNIFDIHPYAIRLLVRLWLGFFQFKEHKFVYCFQHTLNPLYDCDNILKQQHIYFFTALLLTL